MEMLEKDKPYMVQVTKVESKAKRPSFVKDGNTYYNFIIGIKLKNGETGNVEYASPVPNADIFVVGTTWQWIKCLFPDERGCQVAPCEPPGGEREVGAVSKDKAELPELRSVSGLPMNYAMAYAKDIKVAQIRSRMPDEPVTDQDIQDVVKWAKVIAKGMTE